MSVDAREAVSGEDANIDRLYDVESYVRKIHGGVLVEDPYERWAELRAQSPVHSGSVAELMGVPQAASPHMELPHYSAFSFAACDTALRDNETFSSEFYAGFITRLFGRSILEMTGPEHRKYRALVTPAFVPGRRDWWIDKFITTLVDDAVSAFEDRGSAELNGELCARVPLHTITSSFGMTRREAWRFREV
jgi:cytochrome P450